MVRGAPWWCEAPRRSEEDREAELSKAADSWLKPSSSDSLLTRRRRTDEEPGRCSPCSPGSPCTACSPCGPCGPCNPCTPSAACAACWPEASAAASVTKRGRRASAAVVGERGGEAGGEEGGSLLSGGRHGGESGRPLLSCARLVSAAPASVAPAWGAA